MATNEYGEYDRRTLSFYGLEMLIEVSAGVFCSTCILKLRDIYVRNPVLLWGMRAGGVLFFLDVSYVEAFEHPRYSPPTRV